MDSRLGCASVLSKMQPGLTSKSFLGTLAGYNNLFVVDKSRSAEGKQVREPLAFMLLYSDNDAYKRKERSG